VSSEGAAGASAAARRRVAASRVATGGRRLMRTLRSLLPATESTLSRRPSTATVSFGLGMRPNRWMMRPPIVSKSPSSKTARPFSRFWCRSQPVQRLTAARSRFKSPARSVLTSIWRRSLSVSSPFS